MANMKIDAATQLNKPDGVTIDVNESGELYAKTAIGGVDGHVGVVKPDNTTVTVDPSSGVLTASQYSLPIATNTILGGVKPDNATITNNQGSISNRIATSSLTGVVRSDNVTTKITTTGILSAMTAWPTGTRQTITAPAWTSYSSSLSRTDTQWSFNVNGWFRARVQQDTGDSRNVDLRLLVYTADGANIILEQAANSWIGTASILRLPACVSVPVPVNYIVYLLAYVEATSNLPVLTCYFTPSVS